MGEYILENDNEADRLERQNSGELYNVAEELSGISFSNYKKILDVGCGTGALTREIVKRNSDVEIVAVDFSEVRLKQAQLYLSSNYRDRVVFQHANIMSKEGMLEKSYDCVVSRFVLHHLPNPSLAVVNMVASLKNEGKLIVIDSDGIMFNFYCSDKKLMSLLNTVRENFEYDFMIGRKLKSMFIDAGLTEVDSRMIPMHFVGESLKLEVSQYRERFGVMMPYFVKVLGERDANSLVSGYISTLERGAGELFYNKFVCTGVKHDKEGKV